MQAQKEKKRSLKSSVLLPLGILAVSALLTLFVIPSDPVISGHYIAPPDRDPSEITIDIVLIGPDGPSAVYTTQLREDGSFSVEIEQRGPYEVMILPHEPNFSTWEEPVLSNMGIRYSCEFKSFQNVDLGTHYVSEELRILSPKDGEHFKDANEVIFQWNEGPFAQAYMIVVFRKTEEQPTGGKFLVACNVSSQMSLADILALPDGSAFEVSTGDIVTEPYAVAEGPLTPGDYGAMVAAGEHIVVGAETVRGTA